MTNYSLKDFKISVNNELILYKTYYNGYSYILNPMYNSQKEILKFDIKTNSIIKICHQTLSKNNLNKSRHMILKILLLVIKYIQELKIIKRNAIKFILKQKKIQVIICYLLFQKQKIL